MDTEYDMTAVVSCGSGAIPAAETTCTVDLALGKVHFDGFNLNPYVPRIQVYSGIPALTFDLPMQSGTYIYNNIHMGHVHIG